MPVRKMSLARGSIHDLEDISALSSDRCNVRILSDRALYILQNLSVLDVEFPTRYGVMLGNGLYDYVDEDSPYYGDYINTINEVITGLMSTGIEDSLSCICASLQQIAGQGATSGCGCEVGEGLDTEAGEEGGTVPGPIGSITFSEQAAVDDRKCKAANLVHETLYGAINGLSAYPIETFAALGLPFTIGVVTAVLAALAAPAVALIIGVAGALAIFGAKLLAEEFDLGAMASEMDTKSDSLMCALYYATDVTTAMDDYLDLLTGFSAVELGILEAIMTNGLFDLLFFDTNAADADFWDNYTGLFDCSECAEATDHIAIRTSEGVPVGAIVGDAKFEVGDTVTITSVEDVDCDPTDREAIVFEVLNGSDVQIEATVTVVLTSWSSFSIEAGCQDKSVYYGDAFTPVRQETNNVTEPAATSLAGVAIAALRSGGSFSLTVERIA